jgi:SAM-dependent methyltransferase/alpha/beta superfamily hydrolase
MSSATLQPDSSDYIRIESEIVVFHSRTGKRIVGVMDSSPDAPTDAPHVVICPKFGESKKNNLQLSYQLAANGLKVLRFDHSNHVGESDGNIEQYTFSSAIEDIIAAIDYLQHTHDVATVRLVANSLSARCALRVAAVDRRIEQLATLVGVIDFQHTAREVYQRDMVAEYLAGQMQGISDILGHQVDVDAFLQDCIRHDLHTLEGSIADIRKVRCPVFLLSAERDVWVTPDQVERVIEAGVSVHPINIPGAMHELRESPEAARFAVDQLIQVVRENRPIAAGESQQELIRQPCKTRLFEQNRIERDRLRKAAPERENEQAFWKAYLDKYSILESVGDYQEYLDLIGRCLGPVENNFVYFDCGCGNGLFGAWCLRDLLRQNANCDDTPPLYFGLDLTAKGLGDAVKRHNAVSINDGQLNRLYYRFDLDAIDAPKGEGKTLPLGDASVDRICCSLLISYLKRPEYLMDELFRILKPGGKIIISSMKPFCDLSVIYKDVVEEARGEQTLQSARDLLSAAGAIKLKEEEGIYKFYDQQELVDITVAAGFGEPQVYRSFGNQANLVFARK